MADNNNVPLVVDLDGTLIRTDMMWESLARLLRRNPLAIFQILFWWTRGRAWLKKKLAARVQVDPATLPYHEKFLAWLRTEKSSGRKIILATASDLKMAQPIANHIGLFDEVLASNGQTNLRSENKLRALTEKFGARGFDYAGNSTADYAVWRGSRQAVVVNASQRVLREAARCTQLGATFCEGFSAVAVAKSVGTELFWRSGYLIAVIAGLLLAAAFPKFNLAGAAWIAPALIIFAAIGKSRGDAFRVGYLAGLTFWLASLYWLLNMPVPLGFRLLGWISLCAYVALFTATWTWLVSEFRFQTSNWLQRLLWALTGAATWVSLEFLRGWLFTGFPWNHLGVSQFKLTPLIQIAAVTGVLGVSFLVVWFSLALFAAAQMVMKNPSRKLVWQAEIVLPLCAVLACYLGGFFAMHQDGAPVRQMLRVTLIQPSEPQTLIWSSAEDKERFARLLAQSQAALTNQTGLRPKASARQADLLIWPESAVPTVDDATYQAIKQFARTNQIWLMLNADDVEFFPTATNYFNAAYLINPEGRWLQRYHKRQLVIFGEYVPLLDWLPFLKWLTPISGGWTPGKQAAQFEIHSASHDDSHVITLVGTNDSPPPTSRTVKVSPLICFEDVFAGIARDAAQDDTDLLVNLTNDGWFGESAEQWQHAAAAIFRAVENGCPLVRCANNGVSCLIDAHGRVSQLISSPTGDIHARGTLTLDVPVAANRTSTYYQRHGDRFGWGCVVLTMLTLLKFSMTWLRENFSGFGFSIRKPKQQK